MPAYLRVTPVLRAPSLLGDSDGSIESGQIPASLLSDDDATSFDSDSSVGSIGRSVGSTGSVDSVSPLVHRLHHLETLHNQTRQQLNAFQRRVRRLEERIYGSRSST